MVGRFVSGSLVYGLLPSSAWVTVGILFLSTVSSGKAHGRREAPQSAMVPTTLSAYPASGAYLRLLPVDWAVSAYTELAGFVPVPVWALSVYAELVFSARRSVGGEGMVEQHKEDAGWLVWQQSW